MKELKAQLVGALLVILTVAAVICAGINFQQQSKFRLPEDGAIWVDKAGLKPGDILRKVNNTPVTNSISATQALVRVGAWNKAEYLFERGDVEVKATVYVG